MLLNKFIMILNKSYSEQYDCLWTSGYNTVYKKTYNNDFPNNWMDRLDIENERIFYVEFMGIDTFKIYKLEDYVPAECIEQIRNDDVRLLLHCTGHGYHEIVDEIYQNVVLRDKVPIKNVIISSESFDLHKAVKWVSNKYNVPEFRVRVALEFEAYANLYSNTMIENVVEGNGVITIKPFSFENKTYTKKFTCLNGYYRLHRATIVFLLACYDLLDQGFVSYNIKDSGGDSTGKNTYQTLLMYMNHVPEIVSLFENNKDKLEKINNILLDTEYNQSERNLAVILPEHNTYFNESYFTVLTETNFPTMYQKNFNFRDDIFYDTVGRLYSEKIFRCIVYKHPFIATGPKHFLKVLHWLGYKTFHPIIDESYDEEEDDSRRLYMIAKETKRLCELSPSELEKFLLEAKKICDYNFEVLKNRKNFAFDLPIPNL